MKLDIVNAAGRDKTIPIVHAYYELCTLKMSRAVNLPRKAHYVYVTLSKDAIKTKDRIVHLAWARRSSRT